MNNFNPLTLGYFLNSLQTQGKIVYEYNPFRNFRITEDTDINGLHRDDTEFDTNNYTAGGTIADLDTDLLNFNLNYPVTMDIQPSYDGSVNVIFNDNNNIPRLINSRFSVLQNNTYEIVDRIGNNDTNIYDDSQFDIDSSLYKRVNTIPTITFNGVLEHGNLQVGNYVFYIKLADADDNETDFVGESSIVSIFIGTNGIPFSINGGFRDQPAYKSVQFTISNIDSGYDYVKVYYTRVTSDVLENRTTSAYRIEHKYPVTSGVCNIIINGNEDKTKIPLSDINTEYFIADKAKTQVQCQNMLFLGNVNKYSPDNDDLQDISLRLLPYLSQIDASTLIGDLDEQYSDNGTSITGNEYYNINNIYNYTGYYDEEIYRLGVVYILNNGQLSPVYNIRGIEQLPTLSKISNYKEYPVLDKKDGSRHIITIEEGTYRIDETKHNENSKGVFRISADGSTTQQVYGIGVLIPDDVITYLTNKVQGLFFVRQKRIPTILAQMYTLPMEETSNLPLLSVGSNTGDTNPIYYIEKFLADDRTLTHVYNNRLATVDSRYVNQNAFAAICPEFELRQPYFNQLFTGIDFKVRKSKVQTNGFYSASYNRRHYYSTNFNTANTDRNFVTVKIQSVTDNMEIAIIGDTTFRARAGQAEEAYKFRYIQNENKTTEANNLVRGIYSAYLGIVGNLNANYYYDIYVPGYVDNTNQLFQIRYEDDSPFYAISDRIAIEDIKYNYTYSNNEHIKGYTNIFYRGDCYICNFTHRLNRNFQDPEAPTNDDIVDPNTWVNNYSYGDKEKNGNINRGDVNAIQLGSWITLKVRSTYNLSIRSLDPSYPDEEGLTGLQRGFYPLQAMSYNGNAKIPSSEVINEGYSSTVGERYNFTLPDVPYIKNRYDTRIMYSDIAIGDAFKNGYRVFNLTHYRDYPKVYGSITALVELRGNIVCVFEHGIALIPVNERTVAGEGGGGNVYINTSNVLPENPKIISDTFGSQWSESVIKTPYGIYGVDTIGKKIWRTNGENFECISDFNIQEFLNNNISLTERELTPIIGIRNVKSHYNKYKGDIMFTFYDNLYGFEEKVWNVCYNELLQKWITFYSWIPSYSANVYNQYFSFDRNTSKWITKLGTSLTGSNMADGVTLSNVIIPNNAYGTTTPYVVGELSLSNRLLPSGDGITYEIEYELCHDNYGNYKAFKIEKINEGSDDNPDYHWYLELTKDAIDLCSELYQREGYLPADLAITTSDNQIVTANNGRKLVVSYSESTEIGPITELIEGSTLWHQWRLSIATGHELDVIKNDRGIKQNLVTPYRGDKIVTFLNIRAKVTVSYTNQEATLEEAYQNYINGVNNSLAIEAGMYESTIAVIPEYNMQFLTTDFWKHGQAGIIDIADKITPTYWYGKQHPFEFEFVVADNPDKHKIFDNLEIISNNAEPESFHYEIVGDCYDFAKDKKNMYIRQEATKELYQYNGCDITYDHDYTDLTSEHRSLKNSEGKDISGYYDRSTLMPLYYSRQDTINEVEDAYHLKDDVPTKDFSALAGGEIVHYKTLDEYRIWNHAKAVDMQTKGRLRGNMQYNEDQWLVQINPINLVYKNEKDWTDINQDLITEYNPNGTIKNSRKLSNKIPIELGQSPIPDQVLEKGDIIYDWDNPTESDIPENSLDRAIVSWGNLETKNEEVKLKDKWIKIRIRYTGNKLAVITAIKTLYSISYS